MKKNCEKCGTPAGVQKFTSCDNCDGTGHAKKIDCGPAGGLDPAWANHGADQDESCWAAWGSGKN